MIVFDTVIICITLVLLAFALKVSKNLKTKNYGNRKKS